MEIAIRGKYSLRYNVYIDDTKAGMKDIEIVCWDLCDSEDKYCYTVATFEKYKNECCELRSCGDRLLKSIDTLEDLENIKVLEEIGSAIIMGDDEVELFKV